MNISQLNPCLAFKHINRAVDTDIKLREYDLKSKKVQNISNHKPHNNKLNQNEKPFIYYLNKEMEKKGLKKDQFIMSDNSETK